MLTLEDIRDVKFRKSNIGGYKAEEVDEFIDKVNESFKKLESEKEDLLEKVKILADKVCEYREQEESIKSALLNAQKAADNSLKEAKIESERIIRQANLKSKDILEKAELDIEDQKAQLAQIKQNVRDFRNNILNMYKDHIKQVNAFNSEDRVSVNTAEKVSEQKKENITSKTEIQAKDVKSSEKSENKFEDLKFGENYKIEGDKQESPVGLFN